jgi:hypothetical protein
LPSESVPHLFWECEHVINVIQRCYRWIRGLDWYRGREMIDKTTFFMGISHEWTSLSQTDLLWKHYVKFFIYSCRLRRKMPTFPSLRYEMDGFFGLIHMQKFRRELESINVLYN